MHTDKVNLDGANKNLSNAERVILEDNLKNIDDYLSLDFDRISEDKLQLIQNKLDNFLVIYGKPDLKLTD